MRRPYVCDRCQEPGLSGERGRVPIRCRACVSATKLRGPVRPSERNTAITLDVGLGIRSLEEIAADHGITRERVRQIAKSEGVDRNHKPRPALRRLGNTTRCRDCGQRVAQARMREHRLRVGHTARAGGRITQTHLDLIREFYQRGLGYLAIGDALGVPFTTVKYWVLWMGLTPHSHGHYPRKGVVPALRRELAARLESVAA